MDYKKVVPCLDVKDGRLVKGVHFVDLKEVGDPAEAAVAYSEAGADELVFLDITATLEGRKTFMAAAKRTVDAISVPLTVAGGIPSLASAATMRRSQRIASSSPPPRQWPLIAATIGNGWALTACIAAWKGCAMSASASRSNSVASNSGLRAAATNRSRLFSAMSASLEPGRCSAS